MRKKLTCIVMALTLAVASALVISTPVQTFAASKNATNISGGEIKKPSIKKTTVKKTEIKVEWKKASDNAGYEIQYSTDKNFKKNTKKTTAKYNSKGITIKKLTKNTTYYVRVRTYKTVSIKIDGKKQKVKVYTGWTTKKIKTAKK